jgi:hypothetical protein
MNWSVFWGSFIGILTGSFLWEAMQNDEQDPTMCDS